jgi:hypothetical protein
VKRDLAAERADREACAPDFLARWDEAAEVVLADPDVWLEEARRTDAPMVPWPPRLAPRGWLQALGLLAEGKAVEVYFQIAGGPFGDMLLPPMIGTDPDFQMLLRVVLRAADAGQAALVAHYGGDRLSLAREYQKMQREVDAELARRAGGGVRAGFKAAGLSPSAAYRAEGRAAARMKRRDTLPAK